MQGRTRVKREVNNQNENTTNWESYLEFKVILPEYANISSINETQISAVNSIIPCIILIGLGALILLSLSSIFIITKKNKFIN